MDKRKKYVIVLDVETANSNVEKDAPNDGLCYDIGFGVYDKKGNEYLAKSWVVSEIFNDNNFMTSAYYKKKLPKYFKELENNQREIKTICQAKKEIREIIELYNIKEVYAYNALFDYTTLNNTIRFITGSKIRYFLPYGIKVCDIWNIACQVLGTQETFKWENIRNKKGNRITSAERMFAYMADDQDFEEEHIGLADVRIEAQILARCLRTHKTIDKSIYGACWRYAQG